MNYPKTDMLLKRVHDPRTSLKAYQRIVLLTEGYSTPYYAKTAMSLLRYRREDIVAVLDLAEVGRCAQDAFGIGDSTPFVASLDGLDADALFLGTSVMGGAMPKDWRSAILDALSRGMDVVSGMHDFLSDDAEFSSVAVANGCRLIDVRQNNERVIATGQDFREGCLRIHTVGQDCSLGKMVASLEIQLELARRGMDAEFVATGQTGIMVSGDGVPIDCVVSDFVNGAAEALVRRNDFHDILMIEGQGSISHPSYSSVTLGLLHGCAPDGLIYCYEVGRDTAKGLDNIPLLSHRRMIETYESLASLRQDCPVIGIAMNSRNVSPAEAEEELGRIQAQFKVPVSDVYRHGASSLADAVLDRKRELGK